MDRSVTFLVTGDGGETARFSVPIKIQGTDPTPPRVTARPVRPTKAQSAKRSDVRTPVSRFTPPQNPKTVKPAVKGGAKTLDEVKEQKAAEGKTATPTEKKTTDSEDNQ